MILNAFIRKEERFQINNLSFNPKKLEREEKMKPKVGIRMKIIEQK